MTDDELAALAIEVGVPVDALRTFAFISDPANAHLFTRESLAAALKRDVASCHLTPGDGNVFADLGFPSEEAKRLLDYADADILAKAKVRLADKGRAIDVDIDDV